MKNHLKSEKGALVVFELLVLALVLLAGGYAYYQYNTNKDKVAQTTTPKPHLVAKNPFPSPSPMLVINELGLEVPLTNGPTDLEYHIVNLPSIGLVAAMDTSTEYSQATSCSYGRLGYLEKIQGTIPSGTTPFYTSDESGNKLDFLLKQFNGFYIEHVGAQNDCTMKNGSAYPDKETFLKVVRAVDKTQLAQPYTASSALSLVEKLWNGYNVNTISRSEIESNSTSAVQGYINSPSDSDTINCTQNNGYSGMSYSNPVVSGTTATITLTEVKGVQVQISVDLNTLLISKINCLPYNP